MQHSSLILGIRGLCIFYRFKMDKLYWSALMLHFLCSSTAQNCGDPQLSTIHLQLRYPRQTSTYEWPSKDCALKKKWRVCEQTLGNWYFLGAPKNGAPFTLWGVLAVNF